MRRDLPSISSEGSVVRESGLVAGALPGSFEGGVGRGETRDGDAERRTRYVVETYLVTKSHRTGGATMLSAYPHLEGRADTAAGFDCHGDQLADTLLIQHLEGVIGKYTPVQI